MAHRSAALVASDLVDDLDGERRAAREVEADDQRVDRRAEVVDVGDGDDLLAGRFLGGELLEERRPPERVGEVAVAGRVDARQTVVAVEERAVGGESERDELLERGDVLAVELDPEGLAKRGVGRLAGHEPERNGTAGETREGIVLGETKIQERPRRERLRRVAFPDAAHPRRHAAREDAERDVAASQRRFAERLRVRASRRARGRELGDVARRRRLEVRAL